MIRSHIRTDWTHFPALSKALQDMDVEDEKKPFDAETEKDDDAQPDPDETLMLDQGNGRIWLVKVRSDLV